MSRDFRTDLHPRTARRRLDYWQGLDLARWARALESEIYGDTPEESRVSLALQGLITAQIRFAQAQIDHGRSQEPMP